MKVSKKEFKTKQNQETSALLLMIVGLVLAIFKFIKLYDDYDGQLDWVDVLFVGAWILVAIMSYFNWRRFSRENKNLEVDE